MFYVEGGGVQCLVKWMVLVYYSIAWCSKTLLCLLSRQLIPYMDQIKWCERENKVSVLYRITATEKMQMKMQGLQHSHHIKA